MGPNTLRQFAGVLSASRRVIPGHGRSGAESITTIVTWIPAGRIAAPGDVAAFLARSNGMSVPHGAKISEEGFFSAALGEADPEIAGAIGKELHRQRDEIELIASENIVSRAVLEAQGSVLTNKYAEGLPGKRYYGGCQFVDVVERLAIERLTKRFGCNFANVQPHSGASANAEVFMALMQPGDTFMGLNLAAGGHLTHGSPVNLSGRWFKPV